MTDAPQIEKVGFGVSSIIPEDITTEQVWKTLVVKIKQPNLFLPVTDIFTRPSDDSKGVFREMTMGTTRILENIYEDESILEVKFVVTDDNIEHVNIIHTSKTGERSLEFYKRHSETGERVFWDVPKQGGLGAIIKVLDVARTL